MSAIVQMAGVSKIYGHIRALEGIDLELNSGELLGVVGPDGSGKTTLARLAAGVLQPSSGYIGPQPRARAGYLSGRFSMYPDLTVLENVMFFARVNGMPRAKDEAERLLDWAGLLPFGRRLAGALSGGMRQKLALVCAVVHQPPLLILDEPTTAVDPLARLDFWSLLTEQAKAGRAVLVTTPYLDEAEHCGRILLLHQGHVLATGGSVALKRQFPYRMALLSGTDANVHSRSETLAAARALPGQRWCHLIGAGARVALDPGAPFQADPGYTLTEVPASLEDVYVWLSQNRGEGPAHA